MVNVCSAILYRICMFCACTRSRYQVIVYRTIVPMVQLTRARLHDKFRINHFPMHALFATKTQLHAS